MTDRKLTLTLGTKDNFAKPSKVAKVSWSRLSNILTRNPPETWDKDSCGWYCPAQFEPAYRDSKNFVHRDCLTFDYDEITTEDLKRIRETYKPLEHVAYTTASHTNDSPRLRLVFPLSRPANLKEFGCVTRTVGSFFELDKLARESDKAAQMMFLPTRKPGAKFWSEQVSGDWVDVDKILGMYDDWEDTSAWPTRSASDTVYTGEVVPLPDTKPGIVGDFCRAFRIPDAIARFDLPYIVGSTDERYTYAAGSRPDGFRLYDDGQKGHSDHNTDPAHGQHNAFDLVRLHKFGHLDAGIADNTAITETPSYKAMCAFALEQPEIIAVHSKNEFTDLDAGEPAAESEPKAESVRFQVISAPQFSAGKPLEWLIKGVVPRAEIAVMYGASGSGKSFLALDLCAAIALGHPWRERRTQKGSVIYVCAEGARGFKQRINALTHRDGQPLTAVGVIGDAPNLLDAKDVVDIIKSISAYCTKEKVGKPDLIVIDTLSATMPGGDENAGKDLGRLVEHCKRIHQHTGALVLLVHHSGKDASKGARGWSGLRAAADAEIEVTRSGDFRHVSITKMKDGDDGTSWSFKLKPVVLGMDDEGEEITSCIVEHLDAPPVKKRPMPQGMYAKNILKAADELIRDGSLILTEDLIAAAVDRIPAVAEGKRDTRRQQASRALQKLVTDGFLFKHGEDSVSLTGATPEEWTDESES